MPAAVDGSEPVEVEPDASVPLSAGTPQQLLLESSKPLEKEAAAMVSRIVQAPAQAPEAKSSAANRFWDFYQAASKACVAVGQNSIGARSRVKSLVFGGTILAQATWASAQANKIPGLPAAAAKYPQLSMIMAVAAATLIGRIIASYRLEKKAKAGDAQAQYRMGLKSLAGVRDGENTSRNDAKYYEGAIYWFEKAADQGHIDATMQLDEIFDNELGRYSLDYDSWRKQWYLKGAQKGDAAAQNRLGKFYAEFNVHTSRRRNRSEAAKWLEAAANQGSLEAMVNLGNLYVDFDPAPTQLAAKGMKWLRKAAKLGDQSARKKLTLLAEEKNAESRFRLGKAYYTGHDGIAANYAEAARQFRKAALGSGVFSHLAQYFLGVMYRDGTGVDQNPFESYKWFLLAAANQHSIMGFPYKNHDPGDGLDSARSHRDSELAEFIGHLLKDPETRGISQPGSPDRQIDLLESQLNARDITLAQIWASNFFAIRAQGPVKIYNDAQDGWRAVLEWAEHKAGSAGIQKDDQPAKAEKTFDWAMAYYTGKDGVPRNYAAARPLFLEVAKGRKPVWLPDARSNAVNLSRFHLGKMSYYGQGVPKDWVEAYKWSLLASMDEEGVIPGVMGQVMMMALGAGQSSYLREQLEARLSKSQIAEGQSRAQEFLDSLKDGPQ